MTERLLDSTSSSGITSELGGMNVESLTSSVCAQRCCLSHYVPSLPQLVVWAPIKAEKWHFCWSHPPCLSCRLLPSEHVGRLTLLGVQAQRSSEKTVQVLIWEEDGQLWQQLDPNSLKTQRSFFKLMLLKQSICQSKLTSLIALWMFCLTAFHWVFIDFTSVTSLLVYFLLSREMVTVQFTVLISSM